MGETDKNEEEKKDEDQFFEYLIEEGYLKHVEQQIGDDLIPMINMETLVNEDIIFEDTGINVRSIDQQEFVDRIAELES